MVETKQLLNTREISRVSEIIHSLEDSWVERSEGFYTLGASSYLDAATESYEAYQKKAEHNNNILRENLSFLYEKLERELEKFLDEEVSCTDTFALPGFHIWLEEGLPKVPGPTYHFDVQHLTIPWEDISTEEETNEEEVFTFTLPIELPREGGGLDIWDIDHDEIAQDQVEALIPERKRYYCKYKPGKVVIHSGLKLHRVAATPSIYPEDRRITLQGHGRYINGKWELYW